MLSLIADADIILGLGRDEAYMLSSVFVDLKICEVVDKPNWIVSAYLPQKIFLDI